MSLGKQDGPEPIDANIDEIVERFEDEWECGNQPSIGIYLPPVAKDRFRILVELVHVDLERRIRLGHSARAEFYFQRFPELLSNADTCDELILSESRVRRQQGEVVSLGELQIRFPTQFPRLQARLEQDNLSDVAEPRRVQPPLTPTNGSVADYSNGLKSTASDPKAGVAELPEIPGYNLHSVLGEGGSAIVYLATQHSPRRHVAIKMLHATRGQVEELSRRLRAEAEVVAQLQHPNIVQIHEVGQHCGEPFLVMEYLDGGSLHDRLADRPFGFEEAAVLVRTLAIATEAAHERGIIHRDLKPSNVLFGADGRVKISDFGLAKQLGADFALTQTGEILGTPSFMAPEQAVAAHADVGPLTDVYALGAMLYASLCGRPPFKAASLVETLEQVRLSEPVAPTALVPKLPRDLETICLKSLEKQPHRRYSTAAAMAEDLARFLRNEPIEARPTNRLERAYRWCQRNRLPTLLGASVGLVFAVGATISTLFAVESSNHAAKSEDERIRAVAAQHTAEQQHDLARQSEYFAQMRIAQQGWDVGNVAQCLDILERLKPQPGESDLRGFEYYRLLKLCHQNVLTLKGHTGSVMSIAQPAHGAFLVSGGADGKLIVWDSLQGKQLSVLATDLDAGPGKGVEKEVRGVRAVAVSSDGTRAASATLDEIQIWDLESGQKVHQRKKGAADCFGLTFSPNGKLLAAVVPVSAVQLWDSATGSEVGRFAPGLFAGNISALAFSPDGATLAIATGQVVGEGMVRFLDPQTMRELTSKALRGHRGAISALAFSADGKKLATGSIDQTVNVWDLDSKQVEVSFSGHRGFVTAVAFSADGKECFSAGSDHTVIAWNLANGRSVTTLRGHMDLVTGLLLDSSRDKIITSSGDSTIRIWSRDLKPYHAVRLAPDPTALQERTSPFLDAFVSSGSRPFLAPSVSLAPDRHNLAAIVIGADGRGSVEMRAIDRPESSRMLTDQEHPGQSFACCAHSPDGSLLAAGSGNFLNAFMLAAVRGHAVPKSADVMIWDLATGQVVHRLTGHQYEIFSLAYSDSGKLLASGDTGGAVNLWRMADQSRQVLFEGDKEPAIDVRFSPDGKFVAAASAFQDRVRIWEIETGKVVNLPTRFPTAIAFSPDDSGLLAVGSGSFLADRSTAHGEVVIWDWRRGVPQTTLKGHTQFIRRVFYTSGGTRLWSIGFEGVARLWDLKTNYEIVSLDGDFRYALSADLSADGSRLVLGTENGQAMLWDASTKD